MSHCSYFLFYFILLFSYGSDHISMLWAEIFFFSAALETNAQPMLACVCGLCWLLAVFWFEIFPNWWNIHLMCVCGAVRHLLDISECHKLISIIRNAHLTRFASSHLIFGRCFYWRLHSKYNINGWTDNELEFIFLFIFVWINKWNDDGPYTSLLPALCV